MKSETIFRHGSHAVVMEGQEFEVSLSYVVSLAYITPCLKNQEKNLQVTYSQHTVVQNKTSKRRSWELERWLSG